MATIGLTMIVKNEARIIRRCLDSARSLVDYVLVVDTGSNDGTQNAVRAWLAEHKMAGEVVDEPWRDFAHNRSSALERLRRRADIDYALTIDADEVLEFDPGFDPAAFKAGLSDEIYNIVTRLNGDLFLRAQLTSNRRPFRYVGVLYECIDAPGIEARPIANGIVIRPIQDGARNANPDRKRDDIRVLEKALSGESDPFLIARYSFYLARTYAESGDFANALVYFARRTKLGHSAQERYVSHLQCANLKRQFGLLAEDILGEYRAAIDLCPERAEAYHGASNYLRLKNRFAEGFEIALPALDLRRPPHALYSSPWIYNYGLLDEFAVNAYWSGHYVESLQACVRIMSRGDIDVATRIRVEQNAVFARDKLLGPAQAAAHAQPMPSVPARQSRSDWIPAQPQGGTEILHQALRQRLGRQLNGVQLKLNGFTVEELTGEPLVVWIHHNIDQYWVQWCADRAMVERVDRFVFVSNWQMEQYFKAFDLPKERCVVLRNATAVEGPIRPWQPARKRRLAYTSTPYRGLSVLLDVWQRLKPADAELHVWSSMGLYAKPDEDANYADLFAQAERLADVHLHGVIPNRELLRQLRTIDYLVYPSIFAETSCLSVIEAMASGCRVICPALAALPETTAGFARLYPVQPDHDRHVDAAAAIVEEELRNPWRGLPELAVAQQVYCQRAYDWAVRIPDWQALLAKVRR